MLPPDVLDVSVLHRLRALQAEGEPDLVADVTGVFLDDVPGRLRSIREAVAMGDHASAERLAHSLKSSAAMLGARALSRVAAEVESRCRAEQDKPGDPLIDELDRAFAEARDALGLLGLDPGRG